MSKKYYAFALIFVSLLLVVLFLIGRQNYQTGPVQTQTPNTTIPTSLPSVTEALPQSKLVYPIDEFESRITKKTFGQYITPENSLVQPERFTGYHTGVDVEYEDIAGDVEVRSISDGMVVSSGYVNGYGGVVVISFLANSNNYLALYGHLAPSSLIGNGERVIKSQQIGILGKGYSNETDGERKHLHFAIIKGDSINYRGYVQNEEELNGWVDPIKFINNNKEV